MLSIAHRIVIWLLPRILEKAVNVVMSALWKVAEAEQMPDTNQRRDAVCKMIDDNTGGILPSVVVSIMVELLLSIYRLGVTPERLREVEKLLAGCSITELLTEAKRTQLVENLALIFPDMPARALRMLYDFAVLRISGG